MPKQALHLNDYKCPGSIRCPGKKADLWNGLSVDFHSKDASGKKITEQFRLIFVPNHFFF